MRVFSNKVRLKTQLVLSFIFIITLILVVSLSVIYVRMLGIFEKNNQESTLREFVQAEYIINNIKAEVDHISMRIYFNNFVQNYLNNLSSLEDYEIVGLKVEILHELEKIKEDNNYIKSMYLIKNNGEVLGLNSKNNYNFNISKEDSPFFKSNLYEDLSNYVVNNVSNMLWYGDINNNEIGLDLGTDNESLMAATRALKSDYGNYTANLIICIKENAINDIYKYLKRFKNQSLYILDQNDLIISSSDKNKIGKHGDIALAQFSSDNGSFISKMNSEKLQIIYYKIKDSGWVLVNQLPVNEYIKDITTLVNTLALIFLTALCLSVILSEIWMRKLTKPLLKLDKAMIEVERGDIGNVIKDHYHNEFGRLINRFNQMSLSIEQLMKENKEEEGKKRFYEIEALRSQINPHFLFNTLNSIKWMAMPIRAANIVDAITYLGEILRPLYKNSNTMCTIAEEIDYVNNYIKIMNLRFGDQIKVYYDIPEEFLNYPILRFILQPLVENSIRHGFESSGYVGEIIIDVRYEGNFLIRLIDNGCGIAKHKLAQIQKDLIASESTSELPKGIGIINVNQRIKLHYGSEYGIRIEDLEDTTGTKVICILPFQG